MCNVIRLTYLFTCGPNAPPLKLQWFCVPPDQLVQPRMHSQTLHLAGVTFDPSVAYECNVSAAVFQSLEIGPVMCLCARSTCGDQKLCTDSHMLGTTSVRSQSFAVFVLVLSSCYERVSQTTEM